MSEFHIIGSSGSRTPLFSPSNRATRSSARLDASHMASVQLETPLHKLSRPTRQSQASKPPTTQAQFQMPEDDVGADASDEEDDDEDDEEDDEKNDDADQPVFYAPSRRQQQGEPGLFDALSSDDDDFQLLETDMFTPQDYEHVEDISDEDEDANAKDWDPAYAREVARQLVESREAAPELILNQSEGISGFSIYGSETEFGDGDAFTTASDDSVVAADVGRQRRVHFETDENAFSQHLLGSVSPLLTRALLPSALPPTGDLSAATIQPDLHDTLLHASSGQRSGLLGGDDENGYDSDATVPDSPSLINRDSATEPNQASTDQHDVNSSSLPSETTTRTNTRKKGPPRGPRRGFFTVEQDKPWGILDATGRKMIMVPASGAGCPPWLNEKILATMNDDGGPSAAASPSALLDESDVSVTSGQEAAEMELIGSAIYPTPAMSNVIGTVNSNDGQPTLAPLASWLPNGGQTLGDVVFPQEDMQPYVDLDLDDDLDGDGDIPLDFENFFSYGSDSDDGFDEAANPTYAPLATQSAHAAPSRMANVEEEYAFLNPSNVASFRRRADAGPTNYGSAAGLNSVSASARAMASIQAQRSAQPPRQGHKRKASDSPYQKAVYNGVQPIQRVLGTTKRRKVMT